MDYFETTLMRAAGAVALAATACRNWEENGDPSPLADTAFEADQAITELFERAAGIDTGLGTGTCPESRLGRLVLAARLLFLAGSDEGGRSADLQIAAKLLRMAASS